MIAVRADVAHGSEVRGAICCSTRRLQLEHSGRGDVGLHVAGRYLGARGRRRAGRDVQIGDGDVLDGLRGVVGRGLVEAVVERIEQAVVEAEAAAHGGLAIAPHVPGKADARRGQELGAVGR